MSLARPLSRPLARGLRRGLDRSEVEAPPRKILFIGNSFTYAQGGTASVPTLFRAIAESKGYTFDVVGERTQGGWAFQTHAESADTLAAINSQQWDVVIVQGYSTELTRANPNIETSKSWAKVLYGQILANNPDCQLVLTATWARGWGDAVYPGTYPDALAMQGDLDFYYSALADEMTSENPDAKPVKVSLAGRTWEARGAFTATSSRFFRLFYSDVTYHGNNDGYYTRACMDFATVFNDTPMGAAVSAQVTALSLGLTDAEGHEEAAWNLYKYGRSPVIFYTDPPTDLTVTEGDDVELEVEVTGSAPVTYQWYRNMVALSGETDPMLELDDVELADSGDFFKCVATNPLGDVDSLICELTVEEEEELEPQIKFLVHFGAFGGGSFSDVTHGAAPANDPNYWWITEGNNGPGLSDPTPYVLLDATTGTPEATARIAYISGVTGYNANGEQTGLIFPLNATNTSWFHNGPSIVVKLSGLDQARSYKFEFYASRMGVAENRSALYTLTGANSGSTELNAASNQTTISPPVNGIIPDSNGEILLTVTNGPSSANPSGFYYLQVMRVSING